MIQTLIIDDEQPNVDLLVNLTARYCPSIEIVGSATSLHEGLEAIIHLRPELLFLDVELHNQNGFELLDSVWDDRLNVVMVTAFEKYALQALKHAVQGYLLKPVIISELISVVQRIEKRIMDKSKREPSLPTTEPEQLLAIPGKEQIDFIQLESIIRLEAKGSYTHVYCADGRTFISSKNLKEFDDRLPASFFLRVHHSHIVNLRYVQSMLRSRSNDLIMCDHSEIPISPSRKKEVFEHFIL